MIFCLDLHDLLVSWKVFVPCSHQTCLSKMPPKVKLVQNPRSQDKSSKEAKPSWDFLQWGILKSGAPFNVFVSINLLMLHKVLFLAPSFELTKIDKSPSHQVNKRNSFAAHLQLATWHYEDSSLQAVLGVLFLHLVYGILRVGMSSTKTDLKTGKN